MKCKATECGFTECGLRIQAVTDCAGSQVIVTDDKNPDGTHLLSKPLEDHETCISLGHKVVSNGIDCYSDWGNPLGMFEFACLCVDLPQECECDNTHQDNNTVCRWCWEHGRRHWSDPDRQDEDDKK